MRGKYGLILEKVESRGGICLCWGHETKDVLQFFREVVKSWELLVRSLILSLLRRNGDIRAWWGVERMQPVIICSPEQIIFEGYIRPSYRG